MCFQRLLECLSKEALGLIQDDNACHLMHLGCLVAVCWYKSSYLCAIASDNRAGLLQHVNI